MSKTLDLDGSGIKPHRPLSCFCMAFSRSQLLAVFFVTRAMPISYNICKDEINMHKVQHMSLSFVFAKKNLGIRYIK